MAQDKQILKQKPITPSLLDEKYEKFHRPVDINKYLPWGRGKDFRVIQPPAGDELEVRKEETK
jgi:hypothetical protein